MKYFIILILSTLGVATALENNSSPDYEMGRIFSDYDNARFEIILFGKVISDIKDEGLKKLLFVKFKSSIADMVRFYEYKNSHNIQLPAARVVILNNKSQLDWQIIQSTKKSFSDLDFKFDDKNKEDQNILKSLEIIKVAQQSDAPEPVSD